MRKITKIENPQVSSIKPKRLRVAAYCRVSTDSDAQLESLEAQKTHYERYIASRADWEFAGLYYDEGITGTKKEKRPELLRLIADCQAGKVDFILTKSISRFSRNTADCLELVRQLLDLNIPILFEKENLNTAAMESELFLAILSGMAEGESVSISQNTRWSIQKRFENGTFKMSSPPYGYDWTENELHINPTQAEIVKEIFAAALAGEGTGAIAKRLNQRHIPASRGDHWSSTTIGGMLTNEKYAGDCLLQKSYSDSAFTRHHNHGERQQYMVHDHHAAIISREDFDAVQVLLAQRAREKGLVKGDAKYQSRYAFSGKIVCGICGGTFKRRIHCSTGNRYVAWCCSTHLQDKDACSMRYVRDDAVKRTFAVMMNKLIFAHRLILKPYADALKSSSADGSLRRIQEMQTLLAQNTEKRETLTRLMTQGYIDQVLFTRENNSLLTQAQTYRSEIEALNHSLSGNSEKAVEAKKLLRFAEKGILLGAFDEELFAQFTEQIVIPSRGTVCFVLKCGLTLTERTE